MDGGHGSSLDRESRVQFMDGGHGSSLDRESRVQFMDGGSPWFLSGQGVQSPVH